MKNKIILIFILILFFVIFVNPVFAWIVVDVTATPEAIPANGYSTSTIQLEAINTEGGELVYDDQGSTGWLGIAMHCWNGIFLESGTPHLYSKEFGIGGLTGTLLPPAWMTNGWIIINGTAGDGSVDGGTGDYVIVAVFNVKIIVPETFPVYLAVNGEIMLTAKEGPDYIYDFYLNVQYPLNGTFTWSKVSGQGNVTFSAPNSATTDFSADTPGVYKVKCEFLADGATASYTVESGEIIVGEISLSNITFDCDNSQAIRMMDHATDQRLKFPEWVKGRSETENEPAAYIKNTQFSVKAKFTVEPAEITSAKIWAEGSFGGLNSEESPVTVYFTNGEGEQEFTINTPPDKAGVYNIDWDWKGKGIESANGECTSQIIDLASSEHEIYITNAPHAEYVQIGNNERCSYMFETIAKWSCEWVQAANATTPTGIIQACFDGCGGLNGYEYLFPLVVFYRDLNYFLDEKKGACGEWAGLLHEAIAFQGVNTYDVCIVPDPNSVTWGNHPDLERDESGNPIEEYCYYIEKPAMGGSTGPWIFSDHAFIMTGQGTGTVYDPTYYLSNSSGFGSYEDQVVSKFTISIFEMPDGFPAGVGEDIWDNPAGNNSRVYGIRP